jgi:predicted transcriptional regulator
MKYHKYLASLHRYSGAGILEALHNLLFELAGEDRLNMLYELKNEPLRLSYLSKKLAFTIQETSRNIARLSQAKLIMKQTDGSFRLTPYGEETLDLLAGFNFLSQHREYFLRHMLSTIPKEFSYSIASLGGSQLVDDVMVGFSNVENMIQNAKEYIWILSNQILVSTLTPLKEALKRGVEFKLMLPSTVKPPKDALERMNDPIFEQTLRSGKFQERFLERIDALICLSEKEVAALGFPNAEGKLDYHSFHATDELSFKWTKALYLHYWNTATETEQFK